MQQPVAIVGMACRFGGAPNLAAYWDLLKHGREGTIDYPGGRTAGMDRFYAAAGAEFGPPSARAGFLDDIDCFDASFFAISPREAELMDPQQRVLLELTWDAFEDAGLTLHDLSSRRTGVFVGIWSNGYERVIDASAPVADLFSTVGNNFFGVSGRLAYSFDLKGPELAINTGCASSLTAIHQARAALLAGDCDIAIAAGTNILLRTDITQAFARAGLLAADGRCKFGDSAADGFVRSEGAGVVVLKRLADARPDGDRVYAIIRGSAVNNNGARSVSLTQPSERGQSSVVRDAIESAGMSTAGIDYIEAHGTGTVTGDRIELTALSELLGHAPNREAPCRIGSVKSNIGHTEAAAGVAGVIKTALALHHRFLPPTLHVNEPNPEIDWPRSGLTLQTNGEPWVSELPRNAGVSSFGLGGANAHVVLEEAPAPSATAEPSPRDALILALSARSSESLKALAASHAERLEHGPDAQSVCYTATVRRSSHPYRVAVTGAAAADLSTQLRRFSQDVEPVATFETHAIGGRPQAVMVFPGQGSQWTGMGRRLFELEPVFRASIEATDAAIRAETGWSLIDQLLHEDDPQRLGIERVQPALFAIQVALARLWTSFGQKPAVCVGHSMGEVAAAHVAGALSLHDAVAVICRRSALMARFKDLGAMAVVDLTLTEAERELHGREQLVSVAASNGPRTTVLSGDPEAIRDLLETFTARGVFCRAIAVDVAAHSPQMGLIADELVHALHDISPREAHTPIYSTTLGRFADGAAFDAAYWAANLRQPVLFHPAIEALVAKGYEAFIEVSPHPVLLSAIEETAANADTAVLTIASLHRDQSEQTAMFASLGRLYERGFDVDWRGVYRAGTFAEIPSYPWQRKRYWVDDALPGSQSSALGGHPLLGGRFDAANGEHVWNCAINADALPWLKDHVIRGSVLLPATAYVEMALAVAAELVPDASHALSELTIKDAIVLRPGENTAVQIVVTPKSPGRDTIRYFVQERETQTWLAAAAGVIARTSAVAPARIDTAPFAAAAGSPDVTGAVHSESLTRHGYTFGPNFRCIDWYSVDDAGLIAAAHLPEATTVAGYGLHPALLDAAFQSVVALLLRSRAEDDQLIPFRIAETRIFPNATGARAAFIVASLTDAQALTGDVRLYAADGSIVAEVAGLAFRAVRHDALGGSGELVYQSQWLHAPNAPVATASPGHWLVLDDRAHTGTAFAEDLVRRGSAVRVVSGAELAAGPAALLATLRSEERLGVVDFRALDLASTDRLADVAMHGSDVAALASALDEWPRPCRLWLVTRAACAVAQTHDVSLAQASVWGLGAVIANERPDLGCSLIDLSAGEEPGDISALVTEVTSDSAESRVALRSDGRFVERLGRPAGERVATPVAERPLQPDEKFDVRIATLGMLESCTLEPAPRQAPGEHEIEIAVEAAGLNFLDVIRAMGLYDPAPHTSPRLGCECAGTVVRVGAKTTSFKVGDAVVALSPAFERVGALTSHIVVPEVLAARKPPELTFAQAAALPCAYLTSYYALVEVARMRNGESLLIHSASGGVGIAAIDVARWLGVDVFATAGSDEKRAYLTSLGVERVMDSRAAGFGEAILAQTSGRGVDAILNSLVGGAIAEGLSALAPYGRFLEIGKRDMWDDSRIGLGSFLQNRSFSGVDLATLVEDRPELVGTMLRTVMQLVEDGVLKPLPVSVYAAARASEALHRMAQAKHIGKLVIDTRVDDVRVRDLAFPVKSDATYLITGGLGALGLVSAEALVGLGARHIVLCGRSAASPDAREALAKLRGGGAEILVRTVDVASDAAVAALLDEIRASMPQLCGVIHCAGVLVDALIDRLTPAHFEQVMAGKVQGALLLDRMCRRDALDFFVLFSSVASLLGNPGQGNYAAANAMLDAIAQARAAAGLPATSIAWGPWLDVGLAAAQDNRGARVAAQGLDSITPSEGLELIERFLQAPATQVAAMRFDAARWCDAVANNRYAQLFDGLQENATHAASASSLVSIKAAAPKQARGLLRGVVAGQLAAVLRLRPEQLPASKPFRSLGLDSLMGLELRNRLERALELKLSASVIWNYPTIDQLCAYLAEQLQLGTAEPAKMTRPAPHSAAPTSATDDLADELLQAEALLASL
jgi:acyl transferase domain-containing protein/NADPH:quinone reductase-like Zn-dependent oxidoreductase/NAD(P)-dependent dehydrogenase (short-subunit alcohol dehydrogenase family)/acyl carrier protein